MRTDVAAQIFYDTIAKKAAKHKFIKCPVLPRRRKRLDYKTIEMHFQVYGYKQGSAAHHPTVPDGYYHSVYFETLDIISVSIEAKFEQPSFEAFLKFESVLLPSVNNDGNDDGVKSFIKKKYSEDLDTD